jgi:putative flippase GtrA
VIVRTALVYATVSGSCLVLHNAIMILADHVGIPLVYAVLISFSVVAMTGYLLHSRFPLAIAATWLWRDVLGWPMVWASPAATACMVIANFIFSRWAIVSHRRGAERT